jgi:hypothetical protein
MYAPLVVQSSTQNPVGMGLYMPSNWVTPERYANPLGGAMVQVPSGWGNGLTPSLAHSHGKKGMGCSCGCGGGSGCSENEGMGAIGLGLFDSGLDISGWGIGEWSTVAVGGFLILKLFTGTKKAAKSYKKYKRRRARKSKLQSELASL